MGSLQISWFLINLLGSQRMTFQNRSPARLNLNDNQECNCFDYSLTSQQYFLLKNIKEEQRHRPSYPTRTEQNASSQTIRLSSQKRSLRKARQPVYQSPTNNRDYNVYNEYYSPRGEGQAELEDIRSTAPPILQREQKSIQFKHTVRQQVSRGMDLPPRQPVLMNSFSSQNLSATTFLARPNMQIPTLNGSISLNTASKPQLSSRISFRVQKPSQEMVSLSPRERIEPCSSPLIKIKYETTKVPQLYEQTKNHLDINIKQDKKIIAGRLLSDRTVRSKKSEYRSAEKEYPVQNQQNNYQAKLSSLKNQNHQSIIRQDANVSKGELGGVRQNAFSSFRSRIDTNKSGIDQGVKRSKINMKKLKDNKHTLHKMNDVQEIRSMMDSDEALDSDECKQSFVLARLIDKDSYMDPAKSVADSNPTMQSKVGYQSTTAGKSTLKVFDYSPFQ